MQFTVSLRAICHSSLDCPVRKLLYCPQNHVVVLNNHQFIPR